MKKVPVLFLIFNRKEVSIKAFQNIKEYQPDTLFIAADGPRSYKEKESVLCEETRQAVLDLIDWPCKVNKLFRKDNLGCANAIYDAITWFFNNVEYGIIIEDDVIISQDFYKICEQLLPYYQNEKRIMEISAQNYTPQKQISNDFAFTNTHYCWGWASWRRAWKEMDFSLSFMPSYSIFDFVKKLGIFEGLHTYNSASNAYKDLKALNSWAFRWHLSILHKDGLVMLPNTNLSKNIGNVLEGAHYQAGEKDLYSHLSIGKITYPLVLPKDIVISKKQRSKEKMDFFRVRMYGLLKKINIFR